MDIIKLVGTDDTPGVILDKENNKFEFSGRSMPEDVVAFFQPVLDWLDEYAEDPNPKTVFDFRMHYFNTASSKIIMDILLKLEEMKDDGNDVEVNWYYPEADEDMKEAGEEYAEIAEIPFNHIACWDWRLEDYKIWRLKISSDILVREKNKKDSCIRRNDK